jgi:hypothetical protein
LTGKKHRNLKYRRPNPKRGTCDNSGRRAFMPRRKPTYSRADVKAAIALMEALGKKVTAVKYHPDGTFRIMTSEHVSKDKTALDNSNPWDEVLSDEN